MKLNQSRAVVTGGGSGIGLAIAVALAQEGCRVAIGGRRIEVLRAAAESHSGDPPLVCHVLDVGNRESTRAFFDWAKRELGPIDILVNSAGINIKTRTMAEMMPEQWDQVLAVNATGAYDCMHAVLPEMRSRKDGLIVNIVSIAGKRASALGGVAYSASKFAMSALGTAVGNEEARHGVRVTNVYPGEVNTPILENRPVRVTDAQKAAMAQPEDIAAMVVALARLPQRAHVPELIVKPLVQEYM